MLDADDIFLDFTENIGDSISQMDAEIMISNLLSYNLLDEEQSRLLRVATSDNVLKLENNIKDQVRARLFKNMLINMDWRV